jgi:F-type H+-transporting ATPase subunit b
MRLLRPTLLSLTALALDVLPLSAQEQGGGSVNLLSPSGGLMFWTLVIFVLLMVVLAKFAFPPILGAVEARERALEEAIEGARRDRDAATALLAEQRAQIEAARGEAQRLIAEGHATSERMRADMLEQARREQQEILERARGEIGRERDRAIAELRREAVDLAIAAASRVVEQNLDSAGNRRLIESYLGSLSAPAARQ